MKIDQKVQVKNHNKVSNELQGSYGKTLVIMSSNPEEIDILCNKLGDDYNIVMDTDLLENHDYAKVIVRRSNESTDIS